MTFAEFKEAVQVLAKRHWAWVVVLVVPLGLFFLLSLLFRAFRPEAQVVDPTEKADARAEAESDIRAEGAAEVKRELEQDLDKERATREAEAAQAFKDAEKKFTELRKDPEKLADAMKRVGRGEKL